MRMADPEVAASTTEFQRVAKAAADIEPTVAAFKAYNEAQLLVQEAREMLRESGGAPLLHTRVEMHLYVCFAELQPVSQNPASGLLLPGMLPDTGGGLAERASVRSKEEPSGAVSLQLRLRRSQTQGNDTQLCCRGR